MARFRLTLSDLSGQNSHLIYDNQASTITHEDGTPIDLSPVKIKYAPKREFKKFFPVSPTNPGTKTTKVKKLKIQLGLGCNYSCEYCSQSIHKSTAKKTPAKMAKSLIDKLSVIEGEPDRIEFWGGEPLLYMKHLRILVPALRDRWPTAEFTMITNGSLLDADIVNFIIDNRMIVVISHDGPGQHVRGDDPFDNPSWVELVRGLHDIYGVSFNAVLSRGNLNPYETIRYIREKMGRDVEVNFEGVVNIHDGDESLTDEERRGLMMNVFSQLISGVLHDSVSMTWKMKHFYDAIANAYPANSMGQKCQMDRDDHLAVDLKGNVLTCQNVGEGLHKIGDITDVTAVRLNTSKHWSHRKCRDCVVLQFCYGSCMFLTGIDFERTCANEYSYNLAIMQAALWFLTNKVLTDTQPIEVASRKYPVFTMKEVRDGNL